VAWNDEWLPNSGRPSSSLFFFLPDEVSARVELLRRYLPEEADGIIREADEICRHQFRLLAYEKLDYGSAIDWHLDAVHGKRAPLKPWFKINFLDFSEVGDHKIIWELNRHQHLVTLAKAWCLTSNPSYVKQLVGQWESWQNANPYPLGINWASTLEVAFRSLSWMWVENLLAGCTVVPDGFRCELAAALRRNGRYIERYLSKYFSPNTHLLGEAVALFFIGTLHTEFPEAKRWQTLGWEIVVQEASRQVRADGVYFEQTLYYHVYALDFFLHARALAARNGIVIPAGLDAVVKKMLTVLHALSDGGGAEGFGDDDGGRVLNPRRNRAEHLTDSLAVGAIEYQNPEWTSSAQLTEESIWICGDAALALTQEKQAHSSPVAKVFPDGGIYVMYDDEPVSQRMMIDAGPQGTGNCGHGHADALSVLFSIDGERCLVDSGTRCYISEGGDRAEFRGTSAHNTIRVDSVDQAVPAGPFAWTSVPKVQVECWRTGRAFEFFEASHNGYCRLADPVEHRRSVLHVKGGFWLIRDIAKGEGTHRIETLWHFDSQWQVRERDGALIAGVEKAQSSNGGSGVCRVALLHANAAPWQLEIASGTISPAYGAKQSAPVVRIGAILNLPAESVVLLIPLAAEAAPGKFAEYAIADGVRAYRHDTQAQVELVFFSDRSGPWSCEEWSSDARVLYCRLEGVRLARLAMVDGSFAKWREETVVSHPALVAQFEMAGKSGASTTIGAAPVTLGDGMDGSGELPAPADICWDE
jgi:Heparinase II/III-like protein/Heparinase II/III N-terminus